MEKDKYHLISLICSKNPQISPEKKITDRWLPEEEGGGGWVDEIDEGSQKEQTPSYKINKS